MTPATQLLASLAEAVEQLERERDAAELETARLAKLGGDQCDEVAALREDLREARERIAELESELARARRARAEGDVA